MSKIKVKISEKNVSPFTITCLKYFCFFSVGTDLSRSLCDDYGHQVEDNHLISSPDGKTTTDSNFVFK